MATPQVKAQLDVLESCFNELLIHIGKTLRTAQQPQNISHAQFIVREPQERIINRFNDALDHLEHDIRDAKSVILRDLRRYSPPSESETTGSNESHESSVTAMTSATSSLVAPTPDVDGTPGGNHFITGSNNPSSGNMNQTNSSNNSNDTSSENTQNSIPSEQTSALQGSNSNSSPSPEAGPQGAPAAQMTDPTNSTASSSNNATGNAEFSFSSMNFENPPLEGLDLSSLPPHTSIDSANPASNNASHESGYEASTNQVTTQSESVAATNGYLELNAAPTATMDADLFNFTSAMAGNNDMSSINTSTSAPMAPMDMNANLGDLLGSSEMMDPNIDLLKLGLRQDANGNSGNSTHNPGDGGGNQQFEDMFGKEGLPMNLDFGDLNQFN